MCRYLLLLALSANKKTNCVESLTTEMECYLHKISFYGSEVKGRGIELCHENEVVNLPVERAEHFLDED